MLHRALTRARRAVPVPIPGTMGAIVWCGMLTLPCAVEGQDSSRVPWSEPPIAGGWDPVESIGQPSRFRYTARIAYGTDRQGGGDEAGPLGSLGVYRDLFNPVYGILGIGAHGYVGQRGEVFDGGLQLVLESPATFLHAGVDWNPRLDRLDPLLGITFPLRRGGWPLAGSQLRFEWTPGRERSLSAGFTIPLGRPLAGRTRDRIVDVELPSPPRTSRGAPPPPGSELAGLVDRLGASMREVAGLHGFFWLPNFTDLDPETTVRETRDQLVAFRDSLELRARRAGDDKPGYRREVEAYHGALERALALAVSPDGDAKDGRRIADQLRRFTLDEVFFPYNRAVGRYKQPDRLDGLAARARARFVAWMELDSGFSVAATERALGVVDAWLGHLEAVRVRMSRLKGDSRMHWLPLALVLRSEQHDTQREVDALVERALGRPFEDGNEATMIDAVAFHGELRRSILETESYHVLWVHDYRGRNVLGDPDLVGFEQTVDGYLRALLEQVRAYDEVGRLPVYLIVVDQFFYEVNDGRLWFDLLEDPLGHEPGRELRSERGSRSVDMVGRVRAIQDSLRAAVAGSRRLQAEARAFGPEWIRATVKVHVNVTNPSDFSFRSRRLLRRGLPVGGDNLLRDHRKIVIRDVVEDDPGAGEVFLAGVGVGEHYATPTWDDRALVLRGPAALEAKDRVREVLELHGLTGARLPPPLRVRRRGTDYGARLERRRAEGATARVVQAHNRTGWGEKEATFLQMLLYDLVPPGTVLYVPDSLWTSREWMAQLVSAALRGCRVYVVGPSLENAPIADFLVMSTMEELFTRLVLVSEVFGDVIEEAGGDLRVGLYTRSAPLDDLAGLLADLDGTLAARPFLQSLFPLSARTRDVLEEIRTSEPSAASGRSVIDDAVDRVPQMHRKTQFIVSSQLLERVSVSTFLPDYLRSRLGPDRGAPDPTLAPLGSADSGATVRGDELVREVERWLEREPDGGTILYFLTGSVNKNVRSMALDGEVLAAVAGAWAAQGYLDFLLLSGGVRWLDDVEDVHALLPPFPAWKRLLSRWFYRVS